MSQLYAYTYNYNGAYECLNKAIELSPSYAQAYYIRGKVHDLQHQTIAAMNDYRKCMELNPISLWAITALAWDKHLMDQDGKAIKLLNEAIEIYRKSSTAYFERANVKYG